MPLKKFLEQEALAFHSFEEAAAVQKILLENGYCVMMSREEHLWLLNWVWTERFADRNGVIFINRAQYECDEWEWSQQHPECWKEEE
jgi:hypothetical protein